MSTVLEAYTMRMADAELPRQEVRKGSIVTGEDPSAHGFGRRGRVVEIVPAGEPWEPTLAVVDWGTISFVAHSRHEIRDVRDRPPSAQIGMGAEWDTGDEN